MNYLGYNYYYKKNLQGDIIEIWGTEDGSSSHYFCLLVEYTYDAWGNILQMNGTTDGWFKVGTANPFRYRGYYYDTESGFYYLQSRYYDPVTGRFLNADDTAYIGASGTILGYSLFAYCENNPVSYMDSTGNWLLQAICGIAGAVVFGTVANILCRLLGVNATTRRLITAGFALIGGILGAAFGATLVGKIAPKALAWVRKLEQIINNKSRLRPMLFEGHVAIGWEWDHRFKIMLHSKHNFKSVIPFPCNSTRITTHSISTSIISSPRIIHSSHPFFPSLLRYTFYPSSITTTPSHHSFHPDPTVNKR